MRSTHLITRAAALAGALLLPLAACGPGRTSAATQATPAAFDPAKSDAKALEVVDQVIAASGGLEPWLKAKEVRFNEVLVDGETKILDVKHVWDKWNGRHQFTNTSPTGQVTMTTYELYGDIAFASADGDDVPKSTVKQWVPDARKRLEIDAYTLFMVFKLKDPGVIIKYEGERSDAATPETPSYDSLLVTFEPGVTGAPGDKYHLIIKKDTHLPAWIEYTPAGKPDDYRIAYRWDDWQTVGGLKLAMKRVNIGHDSEVITYSNIELRAEPDDEIYVMPLQ